MCTRKDFQMRPYIHLIHELENGAPGKHIATMTGKAAFKRWVMRRYFEEEGAPVCFCLEGSERGTFYEVIAFIYMKGKNKGNDRLAYLQMHPDDQEPTDDIPF